METQGWPSIGHNNPPPEIEAETPEQFVARRDAEIRNWLESKGVFDEIKKVEADNRAKVVKTLFPSPKKGTQRYNLNDGYAVKLVYGLTYSLGDKDKIDEDGTKVSVEIQVLKVEEKIRMLGPEADLLCDRLIKWKPELSATEYEKLDSNSEVQVKVRSLIDEILTIKPASPQLSFEKPKS